MGAMHAWLAHLNYVCKRKCPGGREKNVRRERERGKQAKKPQLAALLPCENEEHKKVSLPFFSRSALVPGQGENEGK